MLISGEKNTYSKIWNQTSKLLTFLLLCKLANPPGLDQVRIFVYIEKNVCASTAITMEGKY